MTYFNHTNWCHKAYVLSECKYNERKTYTYVIIAADVFIRARNPFFIFDKMLSIYVLYDMRKRPSSP